MARSANERVAVVNTILIVVFVLQALLEAWYQFDIDAYSTRWMWQSRAIAFWLEGIALGVFLVAARAGGRDAIAGAALIVALCIASTNMQRIEYLTRADPGDHGLLTHPFGLREVWLDAHPSRYDEEAACYELLFWRWETS